jgi:hypothetical protein
MNVQDDKYLLKYIQDRELPPSFTLNDLTSLVH